MDYRRAIVSKSSPTVGTNPEAKADNVNYARRKTYNITTKHRHYHEFKRSIVANHEVGAVAQRSPYFIFEKGHNLSPCPLYDTSFPSASVKVFAGLPAAKPLGRQGRSEASRTLVQDSHSVSSMQSFMSISHSRYSISKRSRGSITTSLYSVSLATDDMTLLTLDVGSDTEVDVRPEDRAPSMFRLREDPPQKHPKIQTSFSVTLQESDTMYFLLMPSGADYIDSYEGKEISDSNAVYEKSQACKSRSYTATQTTRIFQKHRKLYIPRNDRANAGAFASVWDIYDTYEEDRRESIRSTQVREEGKVEFIEVSGDIETYPEEFDFFGYRLGVSLLNSLMKMERMIQRNTFGEQQLLFQGLLVQDPLSLDVKCNYSLQLLWTFENEVTRNRKVTSMCWSSKIHNVLAVGYGKFKYTDKCSGLVCIWNVKNPNDPERTFTFEDPVTFVIFNQLRTQILAVSFYNGLVILIDIISRSVMTKASNHNYPLYYPVWQMRWFPSDGNTPGQCLVTCGKNGKVYKYKKTKFFISKGIMTVERPHGNIQGVDQPRKCFARKTLSSQHPSAEVLIQHPTDPLLYLIGTSEGYVYVCSVNHRHDHLEVFVAHNGPIYTIQFNPFCAKVFLTCGADWCIRIWVEGIYEPIITLESGMTAVQDALWNPLHSTIIVSITGTFIEIWDIRRKISTPKSSTESPTKSFNTVLQFTENKYNICVGDSDGHVHVLALTEMPFSPGFQEDVLVQSIMNALISRPEVTEKLRRLGKPFASEGSSYMSKMYKKLNNIRKFEVKV